MRINHIVIFLMNIFIFSPAIVQSQFEFQDSDPTGTILPIIQNQIRAQYGNQFEVYFAVLDSIIGNVPIADVQGAITDPFGTLIGTIFFWAVPNERDPENEDSVVVGVFKNGYIVWNSSPIYKGGVKQIYASRDLNNDGDVDLVTLWSPSYMYDYSTDIRIFSWNGSSARLISDYDPGTREAKLMTTGSILDIVDVDGNGIYDLRAYWSDQDDMKDFFPSDPISTRPWVTYCWDETKYGIGGSGSQISGNALLPANRLLVVTKCRMFVQNNRFKYDYTLSNDSLSQQSVQLIIISGIADSSSMYAPMDWVTGGSRLVLGRLFFAFEHLQDAMIMPNKSIGGFGYESNALPTIVKYFIQGMRPHAYDQDENPISDEAYRNDILTNSASGYTLGTSYITQPIVPLILLDTLSSYTTQSRTLGWIKDQAKKDKYLGYFASAKTNLQQKDTSSARITLEQVLHDVDIDSTSHLTSEAYALLRYNTEYLTEHLVDPAILSISPASVLAGSGSFTLIVKGINFVSGSIVYWKGNQRATTFIADTILQATILESDVAVVDYPSVTVRNPDGTESNSVRFYYEGLPVAINMSQGWSMVSVPLLQSNYNADVIFPGMYGAMFGYNMIIQDYEEAENLACGLGYWIYYRNPTTVTINGLIPDTVSITSPGGWVMLGSRHRPVQVSSLQLSNGSIVYGSAFGYDQVLGDYVETRVINPGDAVWIFVTKACTITIP